MGIGINNDRDVYIHSCEGVGREIKLFIAIGIDGLKYSGEHICCGKL